MSEPACLSQRHVDAHFAGTITPGDERTMRAHLDACRACRTRYQRLALLSRLDPEAVAAEERLARGLGLGARLRAEAPARQKPALAAAASLVLCAAAFALYAHTRPGPDAGYTARGGGAAKGDAMGQAPFVHIYRVADSGPPSPVLDSARRTDELAFAYENHDHKAYLMIFGVNEAGKVYWYYPAWTDERETPTALPIARSEEARTLPDAVRHDLEGSRLEVHAVFADSPLTVRAVEAAVASRTLPALGASDHVVTLRLVP